MSRPHQDGDVDCWCQPYVKIKIHERTVLGVTILHRRIELTHRDAIGGELDLLDLSIIGGPRAISNN